MLVVLMCHQPCVQLVEVPAHGETVQGEMLGANTDGGHTMDAVEGADEDIAGDDASAHDEAQ